MKPTVRHYIIRPWDEWFELRSDIDGCEWVQFVRPRVYPARFISDDLTIPDPIETVALQRHTIAWSARGVPTNWCEVYWAPEDDARVRGLLVPLFAASLLFGWIDRNVWEPNDARVVDSYRKLFRSRWPRLSY